MHKHGSWQTLKPIFDGESTSITGYGEFGAITIDAPANFNNEFNLSFKFKLIDHPRDGSALLDLDFNEELLPYASIVFINNKTEMVFAINTGDDIYETLSSVDVIKEGWNEVEAIFINNSLYIILNGLELFKHSFTDHIYSVRPWLGNNWHVPHRTNINSILVKDLVLLCDTTHCTTQ